MKNGSTSLARTYEFDLRGVLATRFIFLVFVFFPFRRIVHYNLITRRKKSESSES